MYSKKQILFLAIITLTASFALAQKRHVVIHKSMGSGDSLTSHHSMEHNIQVEVIADSLDDHFIWSQSRDLEIIGDSTLKKVFIHKTPHHERKAARIVIKKSGFFRKHKIIIDFDPMTRQIIKVTDNNKDVAPNKYHKYQDYLEDATDFPELEALHPRIIELEHKLEALELPNPEMLADLETLIVNLEGLESKKAHYERQKFTLLKHVIELEKLESVVQGILEDSGITPPQKIESIAIEDGKFFVNDEVVDGAAGTKCIEAYLEHSNMTLEDLEQRDENISVHISFD